MVDPELRAVEDILKGPIKSKTVFPVLILHLLKKKPDHGYGLMQRIEGLCGGLVAVNTNKIYPLLRRLEERGFLRGSWDGPKRARKIYAITDEGQLRLERIKGAMFPYLEAVSQAADALRAELYPSRDRGNA